MRARLFLLMLMTSAACGDDAGGGATTGGDPTGATSTGPGAPTSSDTGATSDGTDQGEGTAEGSTGPGPTSTSGATSTGDATSSSETTLASVASMESSGSSTTGDGTSSDSGESSSTGAPIEIPTGVYLWTGANGRGGDMDPNAMVDLIAATGAMVELSPDAPPADLLAAGFGTLVYMSPRDAFPPEVDASATALVNGGGRLVLLMEHCKGGCYGNAAGLNALLAGLGAGMRFFGDGGAPLMDAPMPVVAPVPLVTDGVATITVYYTGHIDPGAETTSIALYQGQTIVAHEVAGAGEVVGVADGSMFGYTLAKGDNQQFVRNFAAH